MKLKKPQNVYFCAKILNQLNCFAPVIAKEVKNANYLMGVNKMFSNERTLEPPEFPPADCICQGCEGWFYDDDLIFISNGRRLCPDCFREEIENLPLKEIADLIGVETVSAKEVKPDGRMRYCLW